MTLPRVIWSCAVMLLAAWASPTHAAWNNVFQVCCNRGSQPAVSSYYAPPGYTSYSAPTQSPCCTQYQARCYYEPVTSYKTETYYEPVTSYQTSYYWEPVTSYRTSCYYDPCTCSYQQRSVPTVSYQLKAQQCPVQSWVQRCAQVPVTTYRQSFRWEQVDPCASSSSSNSPGVSLNPHSSSLPPGVELKPQSYSSQRPPTGSTEPPLVDPSSRQALPRDSRPNVPSNSSPNPSVRLEKVVSLSTNNVEGSVVRADYTPEPGTEVLFVKVGESGVEKRVTTDKNGDFRAKLPSGNWMVYVVGRSGKPSLERRIEVNDKQQQFTLLSR